MQFTTKQLLLVVTSIALAMATLTWVHRSFGPNPASEQFTLLDSVISPAWQTCDRKKLNSTVVCTMHPLTPSGGYKGTSQIPIDQEIFDYHYLDFFGNETFGIRHSISGHASNDWADFYLLPITTGGGNVRASGEITTDFDVATRVLRVKIHQQFVNPPIAKFVTIKLHWDGTRFTRYADTEPSVAR